MQKKFRISHTEGEGLERIDFDGEVTMKRLNYSEKNALEEESTDIKVYGATPTVKVSTSKMKEVGILKSVVESDVKRTTYIEEKGGEIKPLSIPYALDINGIRALPQDVGEELFAIFTELNNVTDKKKGS